MSGRLWNLRNTARGISFAGAAGVLLACGQDAPPPELPPRAIRWMSVSGSVVEEQRVISGILVAADDSSLGFEVGGTVQSVEVDMGASVQRDQVLAILDPEPFELAVRDAGAVLAKQKALNADARADNARATALFKEDVISDAERDRARARFESTESQVDAAGARLELAKRDLRKSVLRAPFDGSISVRNIEPAMELGPGAIAFEVDSGEGGMQAQVQVPESMIPHVRRGEIVHVTLSALGDEVFEAIVAEVGTRSSAANSFTVKADLTQQHSEFRSGMTAEVRFSYARFVGDVPTVDGFMIPLSAVLPEGDRGFSVFVFDPDTSTVRHQPVTTAGVRDNDIVVRSGLSERDIIAIAGVSFLRDGQSVTLMQNP
jgi:multidrug efflux system membrane fusion protein